MLKLWRILWTIFSHFHYNDLRHVIHLHKWKKKNILNQFIQSAQLSCQYPYSQTRGVFSVWNINTLRPRQNGHHFPDDIFKCIFLNENTWISIKISLKFVPRGPINNITALVHIMAWRRPGDKPLFEPMMVSSPTHICVTRPQWVNDKLHN